MPQLPIIIPIVVIGILIGLIQKSKKISRRRIALSALVAGALNAANAYAVYILTPVPTFRGATTFARTTFASTTSELGFTIASFLAGFLIVAAVFVIAAVYGRVRKGDSELGEESDQVDTEELSKLKPG